MRISLPLPGSPVRELLDLDHLVEILHPAHRERLPWVFQAAADARRFLRQERAARAVHFVGLSADGDVALYRVGKRGGLKRLWRFGNLAE